VGKKKVSPTSGATSYGDTREIKPMAEKEWIPEDLTEARANQKDFCSGKKRC